MQILGVCDLTHLDVIVRYIMPVFKAQSVRSLPAEQLVSFLAFIGHSDLLHRTSSDGPVSSLEGKRLLEELQRHAVIATDHGPMRFGDNLALHMPKSLGCKVTNEVNHLLHQMCLTAHAQIVSALCFVHDQACIHTCKP